jgi:hypothetical protein
LPKLQKKSPSHCQDISHKVGETGKIWHLNIQQVLVIQARSYQDYIIEQSNMDSIRYMQNHIFFVRHKMPFVRSQMSILRRNLSIGHCI